MKMLKTYVAVLSLAMMLTACGSGQSSKVSNENNDSTNMNQAPIAMSDRETIYEDTSKISISVLDNDTDAERDILSIINVTSSGKGGLTAINGRNIEYTPSPNFHGVESFFYTIKDTSNNESTTAVHITVLPINDTPVARISSIPRISLHQTISLDGNLSTDIESSALSYSWSFVSKPQSSVATIQDADTENAIFVVDVEGAYEIQLAVSDGEKSSTASVNLNTIKYRVINELIEAVTERNTTNTYDENGRVLSQTVDNGNNGIVNKIKLYTYDNFGNILTFSHDDLGDGRFIVESYTYNHFNKILTHIAESNDTKVFHIVNTYDNQGNRITTSKDFNGDGVFDRKFTNIFDANGNILISSRDDAIDGVIESNTTYTYDNNNNLLTKRVDNLTDGSIEFIRIYTYDNNNNLLTYSVDNGGTEYVDLLRINEYDDRGNLILKAIDHDGDGNGTVLITNTYTYDENNNRLSISLFRMNGNHYNAYTSYNDKNLPIQKDIDINGDDTINSVTTFMYDEDNNILMRSTDNELDGTIDFRTTYIWVKI